MLPPSEEPLLPSQEWEQISQMPGAYENKGLQHTEILLTRSWNTGTEIWVRGNKGELLRYDVVADEWEAINITDSSSSSMMLFLDNKESLWVARRWNGQVTKLPLFMHYDDNKHQFVEANIIFGNVDALRVAAIKLDAKGLVWVILADDTKRSAQKFQLYSIDLTTSEIKYHSLGDEDILPSLTILPDDTIVILGRQSKKYQDRSTLLVYDPQTTQVREIPIAPSIYPYNAESNYGPLLFLDTASRLWINDLGWVDLSKWESGYYQWFEVVRSPVFIGMFIANPSWGWGGPYFTYETPDGKIWYDSPRGAGWVDPTEEKWCVFTSYSSKILADSEQNLWMSVNGWLYRNSQYSNRQ
jgi:hypothetical protein